MANAQSERSREERELRCEQSQERTAGGSPQIPHTDIKHDDAGGHGTSEIQRGRSGATNLPGSQKVADPDSQRQQNCEGGEASDERDWLGTIDMPSSGDGASNKWPPEPNMGRVVDGVAHGVDRLKALGNGQVPAVVALAWRTLTT